MQVQWKMWPSLARGDWWISEKLDFEITTKKRSQHLPLKIAHPRRIGAFSTEVAARLRTFFSTALAYVALLSPYPKGISTFFLVFPSYLYDTSSCVHTIQCSVSCGTGIQVRGVECMDSHGKLSTQCNPHTKPPAEQVCTTGISCEHSLYVSVVLFISYRT